MGKKRGPEDTRTVGQRFHDALQEACELLIRARMVPDRAGADTQVITHIPLRGAARQGRRVGAGGRRGSPAGSAAPATWPARTPRRRRATR